MSNDYIPRDLDALITWLTNYVAKLSTYQVTLGISAGDITAATNDLAALQYVQTMSVTYKTWLENVNDYKRQMVFGPGPIGALPVPPVAEEEAPPAAVTAWIIKRVRALVAQLKAHDNYTTPIGEDLGIVAPGSGGDDEEIKPTATAKALPGSQVELKWKKGNWDGVVVECRRDDETTWTVLGQDRFSPFIDTREPLVAGKAEVRRYRLRYLDGDTPVGDNSDEIVVTTIP